MNDDDRNITVPYIVHEGVQVRLERTIKRLILALIMTIILMFVSNGLWIWAWVQYDYVSENSAITNTVDVDGKNGAATYVGDIINGSNSGDIDSSTQAQAETKEEWQE